MDERRKGPTANQPFAALPAARVVSLSSAVYSSLRVQRMEIYGRDGCAESTA